MTPSPVRALRKAWRSRVASTGSTPHVKSTPPTSSRSNRAMRIGIDARELCGRTTGAGRYLAGLLREWGGDEGTRRHEFVLYAPEATTIALDSRRFATRLVPGAPGSWWEQVRLQRAVGADHLAVFFSPANLA